MDPNGYPDARELRMIRRWPADDLAGLMAFVETLWHWREWGWSRRGRTYRLSTGGWSGNEELIEALSRNVLFWSLCWVSSRRGGHHVFRLPKSTQKTYTVRHRPRRGRR